MRIRNQKIWCINLDRSRDRWDHIFKTFGPDVIRVPAVDGMAWSDGTYDLQGRPHWGKIPNDVDPMFRYFNMFPTTYACNLSHIEALHRFLGTSDPWGIIIEDDTEPVGDLHEIEVPDDCDFFYLIGSSHPGCRLSLCPDGQVKGFRTLAAYALSRRAAILALCAMVPVQYYQADHQIPLRCFESALRGNWEHPEWQELPYRIRAYGQQESIVQHSEHARISTFTRDGRKPWIPDSMSNLKGENMIKATDSKEKDLSVRILQAKRIEIMGEVAKGEQKKRELEEQLNKANNSVTFLRGAVAMLDDLLKENSELPKEE
jgi:hypothetical protein